MINVLYVLNYAGKAGTERYVYSLIENLKDTKINPYFVYNIDGLLVERLTSLGVRTYQIKMSHPFDIVAAYKLSRLCKKLDIDIVHTNFLRENYISILSRIFNNKVRVVYTNHFIMKNNFIVRFFNRIIIPFESRIISVCNKGKEVMISNKISSDKIEVIHNGVDPILWQRKSFSTIREEYNISDDTFVIFCASRFAHDKGHNFLIDSINELNKITDKKFICILANDGPLFEDAKKQVNSYNLESKIIFTGFRKDVLNIASGCDLYVNASWHEALSFAIIEMLAANLPVIATDMGGNSDIINSETQNGLLTKYGDSKELAEKINKIMNDKNMQKKFKENALKSVKERFNLALMCKKTYNIYENIKKGMLK